MGAAGQRFGGDVADAGAGGDAAEARVGEHGDVLAEGEMLEGGGDLVDLLHAGAHGAAADEHDDVAAATIWPVLMAAMAAASVVKTRAGPRWR